MEIRMRRPATASLLRRLAALALLACGPTVAATLPDATRQLVVVVASDWNARTGRLQTFVRDGSGWAPAADAFDVVLGRSGSAWGDGLLAPPPDAAPRKREGDGRSPAGVFRIGPAFGYAAHVDSALPYLPMQADSYCIDVPDSPLYTRIVDARTVGADAVAGSSEPMRRDLHHDGDPIYREGFVIEHNAAAVPGHGSCIFAHLWRGPASSTAGCTAMAPERMQRLLAWLDPKAAPLFVLLPRAEYQRLQARWALPALEARR
jgi:L,D-peptidoglycan transpeptidase YkuD (ErfK/YbiS/YcfS/YnhG family)